jgi:hypothetical protein
MGKWILAAMLLSGCAITPARYRGSDGSAFWGGGEAVANAVVIVVSGTPEPAAPYCADLDPSPPHTCPSTVAKEP